MESPYPSAYPCGSIEEFVLSSNRRKLLGIGNDTKDEHDSTDIGHSSIIYGSDEHLYFHLLQIENEITNILMNNNGNLDNLSESNSNKIKSLLKEATDKTSNYEEMSNNSSSKIEIMSFL